MQQRLAFVVPFPFLPARSGGQAAAAGFARHLGAASELTVISAPGNAVPTGGLPYQLLPLLRRSAVRYLDIGRLGRIGRALRSRNIQRLIVQQPFIAPLGWLLALRYGMRLEVWSHNLEYRRFRSTGRWFWPLVYLAEWLGYRLAERVYFISPDEVDPARRAFGLPADRCRVLPFGTDRQAPLPDYAALRDRARKTWQLSDDDLVIAFFGSLDYGPNATAVTFILEHILPELDKDKFLNFKILIGGKGLDTLHPALRHERVRYLGFIDDLNAFCAGADLLLNPVATGAGVKTKVIDAIAAGLTVISSTEGALGVKTSVCGPKLVTVAEHRPAAYAAAIRHVARTPPAPTPAAFYRHYYWGTIIDRLLTDTPSGE
jgi:glycosyltransferase involved in cell wall biosynthesis